MELKGIKMETAKAVPVAERLRAIKIGRYTVDEGSHSKHFAVAAVCQEAAQEIERLQEKVDYLLDGMRDVFPAAHRLALELECLLLDSKDIAAVSKWWDSAHEALEQWREFCREDTKVGAKYITPRSVEQGSDGRLWEQGGYAGNIRKLPTCRD